MESQAPQRVTGLAQVDVFKREFACWTKQFSTGWGRVRTRRDNYFMACTGREKIKVFEMNQTLLLQCRPCIATCFAQLAGSTGGRCRRRRPPSKHLEYTGGLSDLQRLEYFFFVGLVNGMYSCGGAVPLAPLRGPPRGSPHWSKTRSSFILYKRPGHGSKRTPTLIHSQVARLGSIAIVAVGGRSCLCLIAWL